MVSRIRIGSAIALYLFCGQHAFCQEAVPYEILARVPNGHGTAFSIDCEGKMYIVTARHIAADLPKDYSEIKLLNSGNWETIRVL